MHGPGTKETGLVASPVQFCRRNGRQSPSRGEQLTAEEMLLMSYPSAASARQYAPGISANNTKLRMPAMQSEPPRAGRRRRDALVANIEPSQAGNCNGS